MVMEPEDMTLIGPFEMYEIYWQLKDIIDMILVYYCVFELNLSFLSNIVPEIAMHMTYFVCYNRINVNIYC